MRKHVITAEADLVVPSDSAVGESHPADANAKPESKFCRTFDLDNARRNQSKKFPAAHQQQALGKLRAWFQSAARAPAAGAIVALPTGGGKTFTAVRFLCHGPLSQGYKVVWLAHTHHLLEQAYESFAPTDLNKASEIGVEVGLIAEPKSALTMRVVSGTLGHFQPHMIQGSDDVIIVTLQTLTRAWENRKLLRGLRDFFTAAGEKLFVVFDEAHHAPAAGYRALITDLRKHHPKMFLLGLTATPTYGDDRKKGWLKKLFPQDIIHEVSASKLIASGVLAKPIFERTNTDITPNFDQRDYEKWIGTYRDLPENVIESLALNKARNTLIADAYVKNRSRYGKTIIFAERWHQCEFLCEILRRRGVRADAVYSHVDASTTSAAGRNARTKDKNAQVLAAFKSDELDVIVNVKMLTEGTDVPSVNTVFLTRETTSQILATQMVGRALRGPKFGGTENAYIVSFADNWQHRINFADYRQLEQGEASDDATEFAKRPPLSLISIELIRSLAQAMDSGVTVSPGPFLTLMPIGWYVTQYDALVDGTEDIETIRDLVMVFEDGARGFENFIAYTKTAELTEFAGQELTLATTREILESWSARFFEASELYHREELLKSLLDIARHMAQNDQVAPDFFLFEERSAHDLDLVAQKVISDELSTRDIYQRLNTEYRRADRYWHALYTTFERFKSQHDACVNRIMLPPAAPAQLMAPILEVIPDREPAENVKKQVKRRDGFVCLCCGEDNRRLLQIDHVVPSYVGGGNALDNLQTLCKTCNQAKRIETINFRVQHHQFLASGPESFPEMELPLASESKDSAQWKRFLQRSINFYYQGAAISKVHIGRRGKDFYEWQVELCEGNDPAWLAPHLKNLVTAIRDQIVMGRRDGFVMQRLIVQAPNKKPVAWPLRSKW